MKNTQIKILLVEDDLNLGILLIDLLQEEGFNVKLCKDGEVAIRTFQKGIYSICLLDVMLPKIDGYKVANEIRDQDKSIPIIFITAKSLKEDKLKAYSLGADDFIVKPFDEDELIWKIRAVLKRLPNIQNHKIEPFFIGKYLFDFENLCIVFGNQNKRITSKEGDLLLFLAENKNKLLKREDILLAVWGVNDYFLGRSLDVFISKLRRYLNEDSSVEIENVFNVGFIFKTCN